MKKKLALLSLVAMFSMATVMTAQNTTQTKDAEKKECCKEKKEDGCCKEKKECCKEKKDAAKTTTAKKKK